MLDVVARRYGTRPSQLIGGLNEFQELTIDLLAAEKGSEAEARAIEEAKRNRGL